MNRWLLLLATAAGLACSNLVLADEPQPAKPLLADDFSRPLSTKRWARVRIHDTRGDRIETKKGKLVLALDTLGTDDATVKLRGVRSKSAFAIPERDPPLRISFTLDWNGQRNGSYLTAGVALLPARSKKKPTRKAAGKTKAKPEVSPHQAKEALAFELVGVPPGRNARPSLWWRTAGGLRPLYTEGWPQPRREDRTGRRFGRTRLTLELTQQRVRLKEGKQELYQGSGTLKGKVTLLLFVTGHSNYPERTVHFHDLEVTRSNRQKRKSSPQPATRPKRRE